MANPLRYRKWRDKNLISLDGQTAVVTGANSGIGFQTARGLLDRGASLILACRNRQKAEDAIGKLRAEFPGRDISFLPLDLSSFASVDAFCEALGATGRTPFCFVHCAGVYYPRQNRTKEGFPGTVGVNYIGTVRLAEKMMPLMNAAGTAVFTTSLVDRFGKVKKEGITAPDPCEGYAAYARSKFLLSAYVWQRAGARTGDMPALLAAHPGITATDLLSPEKTTHKPLFARLGHAFLYCFTQSPEKASLSVLAAAAGKKRQNGQIMAPRGLFGISGYPHATSFCRRVRAALPVVQYGLDPKK